MAIGDTSEPVGAPSLTEQEIIFLYQKYLGRPPDANELASEKENALKYSAAGIERQIMLRAGNVASSGIRGDETLAPLTVPYSPPPVVRESSMGGYVTTGPSATSAGPVPVGPTGLMYASAAGAYNGGYYTPQPSAPSLGGISMTTILILAAMAGAAFYFLRK